MAALPGGAPAFLLANRDALETALRSSVGDVPGVLTAAARYAMGWEDENGEPASASGKRLRPLLCLFTAETLGGEVAAAMPGAVAVELIHNFSLVHDDVQDRDTLRHGRPTVWALHGEPQAINLGDYLYTKAAAALVAAPGPADRRMAALSVLLDATARMIRGQWLDISFESRDAVTVDEYLEMVSGKTGALLGAPAAVGAILAGAAPIHAPALARWGEQAGIAFQLRDDYLGIWGDPNTTGKPAGGDILRRKKSLPIVLGLQHSSAAATIQEAYRAPEMTPEAVASVLEALESSGSRSVCETMADEYSAGAAALLESLPLPAGAAGRFGEIAAYLANRGS